MIAECHCRQTERAQQLELDVATRALEHLRALQRVAAIEPKGWAPLALCCEQRGQPRQAAHLGQARRLAQTELGLEARDAGAKGPDSGVEIGGVEQRQGPYRPL